MRRMTLLLLAVLACCAGTASALEIPPSFLFEIYASSRVSQFVQTPDGRILMPLQDQGVVQVVSPNGAVSAQFGALDQPTGIALDAAGNIYVCEQFGHHVVKYSPTFDPLLVIGSPGSGPGNLSYPTNCAISPDQTKLYVTEIGNHRVSIFDLDGHYLNYFGGLGSGPGQFNYPFSIVAEPGSGDLFITNEVNNRVDHFNALGVYLSSFGQLGSGPDDFHFCVGIGMDQDHNLWITDQLNNRIKKTTRDGTLLAMWGTFGDYPGQFYNPWAVFVSQQGTIWVGDTYNYRVQVFGYTPVPAKRTSWGSLKQRFR